MKVLIGGDVYLGGSLEKLSAENPAVLFENLVDLYAQADLGIVNLECPLTDYNRGIEKTGPNIKADKATIAAIRDLKVDLVTLANNHILA
jgi:poly-gamma-glutamate capsule biosynthesis protein CapA/YwtB (metallophosphatase superfamily)